MVQITSALLVAAVVVAPVLGAPLEAREPRISAAGLKKAGHIAGKVASGAGVAATVGSLVMPQNQQRSFDDASELEARAPRISGASLRRAGHIAGKVASGAGVAATVGSLVMPQQRSLEARSPRITSAEAKSFVKGAAQVGSYAKSGIEFGAATAPLFPHSRRALSSDELDARALRLPSHSSMRAIGGAVVGAAGFGGTIAAMNTRPQQRRSLEAREPRFSSAQAKSLVKGAAEVGHYAKSGIEFGAATAPLFPHSRRSLESDELEARAFRMPSHSSMRAIGGAVVGAAGFGGTIAAMNTRPQQRRSLDDLELEAREPNFLSTVEKDVGKVASFVLREDADGALYYAREPNFLSTIEKDAGKVASFILREDAADGALYGREYAADEYYLD